MGRDRQPRGLDRPRPLVQRRRHQPPHIGLDEIPADRLGEECDRRLAHQHRLRLEIFLVSPRRLHVGARHADEVVVLLALPERDVVRARGQEMEISEYFIFNMLFDLIIPSFIGLYQRKPSD